ncbi:hypothetical protein ACPCAB_03435 [Streptomyces koyangensis]|uniref:hypothetical protein n=1 Tax=Streptomyces koyangensis TaxID=188770 RepID=UPI003C2BCD5E
MRAAGRMSGRAVAALVVGCLAGVAGCGSPDADESGEREARADRAQAVAEAWEGSAAAEAWRTGYHPVEVAVRAPRGGLRGAADERAYQERHFALRGQLPAKRPADGTVRWGEGDSLERPVQGPAESYQALVAGGGGEGAPLTVTGVERGEMRLATTRGPATVPAWLFRLEGYDAPLSWAAVTPSPLPRSPVARTGGAPQVDRIVATSRDGRAVTVIAWHGACDDGAVVEALESRGSVVLSGSVKGWKPGNCTKQAIEQRVTVKLERPVGERVLLDAHTGQPLPYAGPRGPRAR